jgi:hypothetical protein
MVNVTYNQQLTALLVIDPYNDFISEGGKVLYRSTVFWTHSATKSCCRSQQTALLMSDLGGRFVSMPSNQPGLIVSTLKLA